MLINSQWSEDDQIRPALMQEIAVNLGMTPDAIRITPVVRFLPIISYNNWSTQNGTPGSIGPQNIQIKFCRGNTSDDWSSGNNLVITDIDGDVYTIAYTDFGGGAGDWNDVMIASVPTDISTLSAAWMSKYGTDGSFVWLFAVTPDVTEYINIYTYQQLILILPVQCPICDLGTSQDPGVPGTPGSGIVAIQNLYFGHISLAKSSNVLAIGESAAVLSEQLNASCVFPINSYTLLGFEKGLFTHLWWNGTVDDHYETGNVLFTGYEISVYTFQNILTGGIPPAPAPWLPPGINCPT